MKCESDGTGEMRTGISDKHNSKTEKDRKRKPGKKRRKEERNAIAKMNINFIAETCQM